ncbi:MerR family transcriptional regulator [Micromonospora sp. WMMD1102]|uniref:MerR family transcriptional regulator n=1 Tax=Micromonospora sp. WMMD1102 TaxID=3016105 RepID=UPI0024155192|nr:MerR family transcriptional regulator [Micromonospora sp. WMMD1102]MDG4791491.1 MerR family transcriptional regulator [Micromonospora sp. WMMD1102]
MRTKRGWSTRELAEIAGTTLKAVRHYHRIGLLDEPERTANGYKQYGIRHLIRLLRIRRLVELGVPLADIAVAQESDEGAEQVFRTLDAELAASIERQQRIREELAGILRHPDRAELPPGFGEVAGGLSDDERAFLLVCSRVFEPWVLETLRELHSVPRTVLAAEFEALAEDASDETRQSLAERYAPEVYREQQKHPNLRKLSDEGAAGRGPHNWEVFLRGIVELYNPAQIDVLQRVEAINARNAGSG